MSVNDEFCRALPKVELHAHLNGSISESTMKTLTDMKGIKYDNKPQLMFEKDRNGTLEDAFRMFKMIHEVTDNTDAVYKITFDVIHDFAKDNVKYLELRTTPRSEPSSSMTKTTYVETVLKAINDCASEDLDIIVRLILAIDRRHTLDVALETVQMAVKYREKSNGVIVGIDLSGDPKKGTATDFIPAFKEAQKHGLKLALHLAEIPAPNETLDVLKQVKPDRIGHGTCLQQDIGGNKHIEQFVIDKKIPLEICMTSNITTMTVEGFDNHHFKYWYDIGHPCTICTDDKGVFTTSISEEYKIAARTFELSREELWELSYNSINYIFSNNDTKTLLQSKWKDLKTKIV
ncbi:hypothetical protein ACF0H5_013215 [Mactra antiquata]